MPAAKVDKEAWTDEHSTVLLKAMVSLVLANRPALYSCDGLEGVSGNGGDRINKKIQQYLKKICVSVGVPDGEQILEEEMSKLKRGAGTGTGSANGTPKKARGTGKAGASASPSPKKRKVKSEEDDE